MRCSHISLAVLTALSIPAWAPDVHAEPVRPRKPLHVEGDGLGSVVFAQLLIKSEDTGEVNGLKDEFVELFNDELRSAGYRVPKMSKSAFKADKLPDSDYILAGTLTEFDCADERNTTCALAIEWELLHSGTEKVVYRMTGRAEETDFGRKSGKDAAKALLLGGLRSLLARPKFAEAMTTVPSAEGETSDGRYSPQAIKRCTDAQAKMPKESDKALGATVVVKTKQGIGSGAIISPDGFILTAAHVVTQDVVDVKLKSGATVQAELLRINKDKDVALLRLKNLDKSYACLPISPDSPKTGEDIYVLGSPGGEELSFSVSRGIVSGMRTFKGTSFVQTDAPINPGNSGGPLVNETGQVLAIASWKVAHEDMEGLGFGVPVSTALSGLALEFADETGTISTAVAASEPTGDETFVDTPEVAWFYVGDDAPGKSPGWVKPVRTWGYVIAPTGLVVALGAWAFQLIAYDPVADFQTNMIVNTVGWGLVGVGAGMIVGSYVFEPKPVPPPETGSLDRGPKPTWSAEVGPNRVQFQLKF
jgi:serine protease Do